MIENRRWWFVVGPTAQPATNEQRPATKMIVAMQETATEEQIQQVIEHLVRMGFSVHRTTGARQSVLAAVGARVDFDTRNLEVLSGVQEVHRISAPYKLAGRSFRPEGTVI